MEFYQTTVTDLVYCMRTQAPNHNSDREPTKYNYQSIINPIANKI